MKALNDFTESAISQNEMYAINGGKKSEGGSYMLDDVEMCYSSDKVNSKGEVKKYKDLKPCDCTC